MDSIDIFAVTQKGMDDTISRQAAINTLHDEIVRRRINEDSNDDGALDEFDTEAILRRLPSAQPETHEKRTETHACDCIERQAALDALRTCYDTETVTMSNGDEYINYEDAVGEIEQLPSAQPERTGRWIIRDNPGTGWYRITCSECGEDVTATAPCIGFFPNAKVNWDYCPNCGADMREPEDIPMEYFESGGR